VAIDSKKCPVCGVVKSLENFQPSGRQQCRACKSLSNKKRSNASLEGFLQNRLTGLKQRHKRKKYEGTVVSLDYLLALYEQQGGVCAISSLPMHITLDRSDLSVSPDRIDNSQGYVEGNIRLVCARVNLMRGTLDDHDFVWWCRAVVRSSGN
jgi:hypothetical protein